MEKTNPLAPVEGIMQATSMDQFEHLVLQSTANINAQKEVEVEEA